MQPPSKGVKSVGSRRLSIVQVAVDDQRQIVPARPMLLETPAGKDVPVSGDAERLVQVVTNYLTNALKDQVGGVGCVAHQLDHGHTNAELMQWAAPYPETELS